MCENNNAAAAYEESKIIQSLNLFMMFLRFHFRDTDKGHEIMVDVSQIDRTYKSLFRIEC